MLGVLYTDHSNVDINGKQYLRVGSATEWAASIKAGYVVSSVLRVVKGNPASFSLNLLIPELGDYTARIRTQVAEDGLTDKELVEYCDNHSHFFMSRKSPITE